MKPYICPLCNGEGKLPPKGDSTAAAERTCHACDGKGIVWPPYDTTPAPYVVPYIQPSPYAPWPPFGPWYFDNSDSDSTFAPITVFSN